MHRNGQPRAFWIQFSLFLLTVMGYIVAFLLLYPSRGASMAALSVLPVVVAGWYFGLRAALVAGFLTIPLNTLLMSLSGNLGWEVMLRHGGPGSLAVLLVGAVVGRFHDLDQKAKQELSRRQQAEEALSESEYRLRAIIESEPECVKLVAADGTLLEMNPAGLQMIEADRPDQAIGKSVYSVIAPEWQEAFRKLNERVFQGERMVAEFEIVGLKGTRRRMETHAVPLRDSDGRVTAQLAVTRDITERKRAEEELTALYNATSYLFKSDSLLNLGHQIVQAVVQEFAQADCGLMLLDKTRGKILRMARAGTYQVDTEDHLYLEGPGVIAKALRTGKVICIPDVKADPDHTPTDPRTRSELVIPLRASKGILGALDLQSEALDAFSQPQQRVLLAFAERAAAAIEIMQLYEELNRHAAELEWRVAQRTAELQRTKERVEAILNNSSDGIILARTDGVIRQTNPAFNSLFADSDGISPRQSLTELVEADQVGLLIQALEAVVDRKQPTQLDLICRRPNGNSWIASTAIAPVWEPDTEELAVICNFHDITERKQMEEELRVALEKERDLNELKSRFSSMVSHEFRTPLATIQSSSDLLKTYSHKMTDERRVEHLDKIQAQVMRLVKMLDDILTLSKAETVGLEFNPQPLDLPALCRALTEEIQLLTDRHQIKLSMAGICQHICLDEKLLRHALTNLLSNAVKYSPPGCTVHFDVACEKEQIVLQVKDEGIGIPEEDQNRLFEIFHRAKNTGMISGTGLGLAIVKQAVEAHGGTIIVESKVGVGTTFTVCLPLSTCPDSMRDHFTLGERSHSLPQLQ